MTTKTTPAVISLAFLFVAYGDPAAPGEAAWYRYAVLPADYDAVACLAP